MADNFHEIDIHDLPPLLGGGPTDNLTDDFVLGRFKYKDDLKFMEHPCRINGYCAFYCVKGDFKIELNLKTFELSQNYTLFYDKLEKSNYFLESILETLDEPTEGRLIAWLLSSPLGDGGQWDMLCALVDKYGVVPKDAMPETVSSSATREMVGWMTLKPGAYIGTHAHKDNEDAYLIISGKGDESTDLYEQAEAFVSRLKRVVYASVDDKQEEDEDLDADYIVDEKARTATLTARGTAKAEAADSADGTDDGTDADSASARDEGKKEKRRLFRRSGEEEKIEALEKEQAALNDFGVLFSPIPITSIPDSLSLLASLVKSPSLETIQKPSTFRVYKISIASIMRALSVAFLPTVFLNC